MRSLGPAFWFQGLEDASGIASVRVFLLSPAILGSTSTRRSIHARISVHRKIHTYNNHLSTQRDCTLVGGLLFMVCKPCSPASILDFEEVENAKADVVALLPVIPDKIAQLATRPSTLNAAPSHGNESARQPRA